MDLSGVSLEALGEELERRERMPPSRRGRWRCGLCGFELRGGQGLAGVAIRGGALCCARCTAWPPGDAPSAPLIRTAR